MARNAFTAEHLATLMDTASARITHLRRLLAVKDGFDADSDGEIKRIQDAIDALLADERRRAGE